MAKRFIEKPELKKEEPTPKRRKSIYIAAGSLLLLFLVFGAFARNGWLPRTDPLSGERFGWFGVKFNEHATGSNWNPLANPSPTPTPQLAKEYIYAGDRLIAVEDANANAIPPSDLGVWRPNKDGTATWWVLGPQSQSTTLQWGTSTDIPAPGDYS